MFTQLRWSESGAAVRKEPKRVASGRTSAVLLCCSLYLACSLAPGGLSEAWAEGPAGAGDSLRLPADGSLISCLLTNGDRVSGRLRTSNRITISIEHPALGLLEIPVGQVASVSLLEATKPASGSVVAGSSTEGAASGAAPVDVASGDVAPANALSADAPPNDSRTGEAQPGGTLPGDALPGGTLPGDDQPVPGVPDVPGKARDARASVTVAGASPDDTTPAADAVWKSDVSFGINGSSGNTERSRVRVAGNTSRESAASLFKLDAAYSRAEDESSLSENKVLANAEHHWLREDSLWELVASGHLEFDEFKDYDYRVSAFLGPAYRFLKNERSSFRGRAAVGAVREFGGVHEKVTPELLLGLDAQHTLSARQKLSASLELMPDLSDAGEFRATAKASWDMKPDADLPWALRLGIEDRYDSGAAVGVKSNDFDYMGSLVREF